jgi:hypothetical protein
MWEAWHVAGMGKLRKTKRILFKKSERKKKF